MKEVVFKETKDGLPIMFVTKCDKYVLKKYDPFRYVPRLLKKRIESQNLTNENS